MRRPNTQGVTLLELTVAIALFAIILAGAAQVLISFYAGMDMQQQRHIASQNCVAVLNAMRQERDIESKRSADNRLGFPEALTARWPNGQEIDPITDEEGQQVYPSLPEESIMVRYTDPDANPIEVTVESSWTDLRGGTMRYSLSTLITDR